MDQNYTNFQDQDSSWNGSPIHLPEESPVHQPQRLTFSLKDKRRDNKSFRPTVIIKQRKLEDSYMKRLMTILYGFTDESSTMEMITFKRISLTKEYIRFVETLTGVLVLINLTISTVENEVFYENGNVSTYESNSYRMAIFFISLGLATLVFLDYYLKFQIDKMQMIRLQDDDLISSKMVYPMIFEMFICLIHCPIEVDSVVMGNVFKGGSYAYSWDSIISVIQLNKIYLFYRVWLNYSMWTSKEAQRTLSRYKVKPDLRFAVKAELQYRPILFITVISMVTIFLLGLAVRTFERSFQPKTSFLVQNIGNAWWLMIITMTTVGFGDLFPFTHLGRFICLIACVIGQLLLSLLVVALSNSAEFNQEESKAYHILKKIKVTQKTKEMACNVIRNFLRLNHLVKYNNPKSYAERFLINLRLKREIHKYDIEYRTSQIDNLPLDEMLKNVNKKISTDIENIKMDVDKLHELEIRLEKFKLEQEQTNKNMDEILKIQANVFQTLQKKFK